MGLKGDGIIKWKPFLDYFVTFRIANLHSNWSHSYIAYSEWRHVKERACNKNVTCVM